MIDLGLLICAVLFSITLGFIQERFDFLEIRERKE